MLNVPDRDTLPLTDPSLYINRELSWLAFNRRVLAQADDTSHPVLERVRFLSIVGTNLDEFFMIRVSALLRKIRSGMEDVSPDGLSTAEQLARVRTESAEILAQQAACWTRALKPALAERGIHVLERWDMTPAIEGWLESHFMREVWPVLTPLAFDPGHPFPHISNLSKNLAVVVRHGGQTKFARVKLPDIVSRFIALPPHLAPNGGTAFVYLEDVVRAHITTLFPGTVVEGAYLFRVVRDADVVIQEDEADDLLESVDEGVRRRRHGALAMLQIDASMPKRVLDILIENFEIDEDCVARTSDRLGFGDWHQLTTLHRPELKYAPFSAPPIWVDTEPEPLFSAIARQDRLVHHPFQSFVSVEDFLAAAVADPHVVAIKMTLYRIGQNSPLVDLLVDAAQAGKQVAVLVELKARFDERNNIQWARRLEAAGVHVVYGLVNLKTHCKLCLVVRKESHGVRRYAHLGTGNYNAITSRVYTDLGLFTARADVVEDVSQVFNYLTGYSNHQHYRALLAAPLTLRGGLTSLIDREIAHAAAGRAATIIMKINAITDQTMMQALYRASQAGVQIDLLVRGVCSLRPGIPGISDNIRVRSIVGRFLEHSRIFWFENGGDPDVYIGSADLMERNLDRRVEVLCPLDPPLATHVRGVVLDRYLADERRAHDLDGDGRYVTVASRRAAHAGGPQGVSLPDAQEVLLEWYQAEAKFRERK
jgi:polyphosphate kinase